MIDPQRQRFGSARFASTADLRRAGMFKQTDQSLLIGFQGKRPIWYSGAGGLLLVAGARGGKLRDVLAYNVCQGIYSKNSMLILDMKGELWAISRDQTGDKKHCPCINPVGLQGAPQHSLNPLDFLNYASPTLVSDTKVFCENAIPASGSANGAYFEGRAREFLEAVVLTLVKLDSVASFSRLYWALNLIPGGGEEWLSFAFEMHESGFPIARRVEEEIAASRDTPSNGFQGILGELLKAFACLSDPVLMAAVSPPYDFSMAQLCESDQAYQAYLMIPAEFIDAWAPVIKSIFVAGTIYKSRAPAARQQTWVLDECAQLGRFPLVTKLFTYGAGTGIRPWAVYQSTDQIKATGPDARTIIPASAACQSYFAVRDLQTAEMVSRMLGVQTLDYDDEAQQERARYARRKAATAIIEGGDPVAAGLEAAHHRQMEVMTSKQHRWLRTPDEVLNTSPTKQYVFCDGLDAPVLAERWPYYEQRFMAGRFHPSPYHPPSDRVRVKTAFGHSWRTVITEPVPAQFAHYPQYQSGMWSRIAE